MASITRQVGTVSTVDVGRIQAHVHLPECDNLRTNWLNVLQRNIQDNRDYWLPGVGEQVGVLLDANGEDGVILGVAYSNIDKPPFSDKDIRGTRLAGGAGYSYNRKTHTLIIRGGIECIVIGCGANVVLKTRKATIDAPKTELIGDLRVRGKLICEEGMVGSGGEGVTTAIHSNIETEGNAYAAGSMLSDDEDSSHHSH